MLVIILEKLKKAMIFMTATRRYSELKRLETFTERYEYLKLGGEVGRSTFGFDRYLNQTFYKSHLWRQARDHVIVRDNGCDLGIPDREIHSELLVHHMNPILPDDIIHGEEWIVDPEFLILTTKSTHNAIHYGDDSKLIPTAVFKRSPNDTNLWSRS